MNVDWVTLRVSLGSLDCRRHSFTLKCNPFPICPTSSNFASRKSISEMSGQKGKLTVQLSNRQGYILCWTEQNPIICATPIHPHTLHPTLSNPITKHLLIFLAFFPDEWSPTIPGSQIVAYVSSLLCLSPRLPFPTVQLRVACDPL